jgi:hypothetical protein
MLRLGVDPDALALGEGDHLLEGRDLNLAVEHGVRRAQVRQALLRAQRLELGEREVLCEPARDRDAVHHFRRASARELRMLGDVGRAGDVVLVARDEDMILRRDQIWLDVIRSHRDRELVRGEGVLRAVAARSAVADHDGARMRTTLVASAARTALRRGACADHDGEYESHGCDYQLPVLDHDGDLLAGWESVATLGGVDEQMGYGAVSAG